MGHFFSINKGFRISAVGHFGWVTRGSLVATYEVGHIAGGVFSCCFFDDNDIDNDNGNGKGNGKGFSRGFIGV